MTRRFLNIKFPNGMTYQVPAEIVIGNYDAHHKNETPSFDLDAFILEDWAANNMNWSDLNEHAKLVQAVSFDHQGQFGDAEFEITDTALPVFVLSENAMRQIADFPGEAILATLLSTGASFSGVMLGSGTERAAVLGVIQGPPALVQLYLQAIQGVSDMLAQQHAQAAAQAQAQAESTATTTEAPTTDSTTTN